MMRNAMSGMARQRAHWMAAGLGLVSLLGLGGCATPAAEADGASNAAHIVTPSDETDNRRRARIRLELASGYYEEGKTEFALDELKQVIAIDPTLPEAYNLRGLIYMRLNDMRAAEDSFRRALTLNSRDSGTYHNLGWLQCQLGRYPEAYRSFEAALTNPIYGGRAKTLMTMGLCQARAGQRPEAERSLARSYELDAGNPITGYNLAQLLYLRGDYEKAQFYIRRLNNSDLANSETLWLGIKVENRMRDAVAMEQLSDQLRKRYPQSKERASLERRAFDE